MKIITALNSPKINNKLKSITDFEIIGNDIQYQEGILEALEKNGEIDLIIMSEILPGEQSFGEIINKIKTKNNKVEIIVILKEKNEQIKNFLISKGIFNIFINNEITIEELIKIINKKNNIKKENEINEEIKKLKEIILENNKKNKIKINNKETIKKIINKYFFKITLNKKLKNNKKKILKNKIISISGINNSGKSIFSCILTKLIINKKILLIDFDIFNKSLNTIFGVKEYYKKNGKNENNIFKLIIKINKNLDLLCATDKITANSNTNNILEKISSYYDLILIDTNPDKFQDITREIYEKSNLIIFLTEANLIQLKKSRYLLDLFINKWNIQKEKINIIFNKNNINSIDKKILKTLFSDFIILGKLKLNNNYNLLINNNLKNIYLNKKIKKEFKKIINKLNLGGDKSE